MFILALQAESPLQGFPPEIGEIFRGQCTGCHSAEEKMGGLVLETYQDLMLGGKHGPAILAGRSEESRLILMLEGKMAPQMPMSGELPVEQIHAIKAWIHSGAEPFAAATTSHVPTPIPEILPTVDVSDPVGSLAFSPDSKRLAVGGYKEVRIVDVVTGRETARLQGHAELVRSLAFSPDGKFLAAAGGPAAREGEVKIWELSSGNLVHSLAGHEDCIYAGAYSPDGKLFATGSYDKRILLWDAPSGRQLRTLKDHIDAVFALEFNPEGNWLASAAQDGGVKIWDVSSGERLYTLSCPDSQYSLSFHPSGKQLASAGADKVLRIWDLAPDTGTVARSIIAHEAPMLQVAFSPDGQSLVTAAEDRLIKVWDAGTLTEKSVLKQTDWAMSLEFSPSGEWLAVGRYDGTVGLYDPSNYQEVDLAGEGALGNP